MLLLGAATQEGEILQDILNPRDFVRRLISLYNNILLISIYPYVLICRCLHRVIAISQPKPKNKKKVLQYQKIYKNTQKIYVKSKRHLSSHLYPSDNWPNGQTILPINSLISIMNIIIIILIGGGWGSGCAAYACEMFHVEHICEII